jgi:hypothetical protein
MDDQQRRRVMAGGPGLGPGTGTPDLVRPSTLSALAREAILVRIVTGDIVAGQV